MIDELIIIIFMIPIRAVFLMAITSIIDVSEARFDLLIYLKAVLVMAIISIFEFLLILTKLYNFHSSIFGLLSLYMYFIGVISFFVIKIFYKFDWIFNLMLWIIWYVFQIALNILKIKLYHLIF